MMTVVVDDEDVIDFTLRLEPAACAREAEKRFCNLIKRHFELETNGDGRQRVVDVVHARHSKRDFADDIGAAPHSERRTKAVVVTNPMSRDISLRAQSVGHATTYKLWNYRLHIRIVQTEHRGAIERDLVDEVDKEFTKLVHDVVVVYVIAIDVCYYRNCRRQHKERTIALIRLDHHQIARAQVRI